MYWNYLERHPNHVPLPPNAEQEARDALAWFHLGEPFFPGLSPASHSILDNLKSGTRSTVPFSKQECEDLLDAMTRINCEKPDCICYTFPLTHSFQLIWQKARLGEQFLSAGFQGSFVRLAPERFSSLRIHIETSRCLREFPRHRTLWTRNIPSMGGALLSKDTNWPLTERTIFGVHSDTAKFRY